MPNVITRTQYLEINTVPLATPAWRVLDLSPLYGLSVRGGDRVMPKAAGAKAYKRVITTYTQTLPFLVVGRQDREGNTNSNIYSGLDANVDYLMTNVVEPPGTATVAAVWHRASGNKTASIHVEGLEPEAWGNGWIRFSLAISIPAGKWT